MDIVKLFPAEKDNLWGGVKLKEKYGKKTDMTPLAETWELAFHKDGKSRLADGRTLEEAVGEKEIGKNAADFRRRRIIILLRSRAWGAWFFP